MFWCFHFPDEITELMLYDWLEDKSKFTSLVMSENPKTGCSCLAEMGQEGRGRKIRTQGWMAEHLFGMQKVPVRTQKISQKGKMLIITFLKIYTSTRNIYWVSCSSSPWIFPTLLETRKLYLPHLFGHFQFRTLPCLWSLQQTFEPK